MILLLIITVTETRTEIWSTVRLPKSENLAKFYNSKCCSRFPLEKVNWNLHCVSLFPSLSAEVRKQVKTQRTPIIMVLKHQGFLYLMSGSRGVGSLGLWVSTSQFCSIFLSHLHWDVASTLEFASWFQDSGVLSMAEQIILWDGWYVKRNLETSSG